ncbi:zinc transporter binding subunit ZevA [Bisgaard Taxon 45]
MKTFSRYCFGVVCLLFAIVVQAHPHAFIDMKTKILVQEQQLIGFSMQWTLDEASSAAVLYDLRQTRGDKEALQALIEEVMGNIVHEHYFSYLYDKAGKKIKYRAKPQNYGMKSNQNQVQYYFDFLLSQPRTLAKDELTLLTYDPTYYVAMYYDQGNKNALDFSALPPQCQGRVIEPQVDAKIREYASSLDQTQRNEDDSLGVIFAQKVMLLCE